MIWIGSTLDEWKMRESESLFGFMVSLWEEPAGPTKEGVLSVDLKEHSDHLCTKSVNSGVGVHDVEV